MTHILNVIPEVMEEGTEAAQIDFEEALDYCATRNPYRTERMRNAWIEAYRARWLELNAEETFDNILPFPAQ